MRNASLRRWTAARMPPLSGSQRPVSTAGGGVLAAGYAYCLAAFAIGLLRTTTIQFVGAMPVGEFLLILVCLHAALALASTGRLPAQAPAPRMLLLFGLSQAIALASYVITDLWRESAGVDMLRGWLRMIFVLVDLGGMALILGATGRAFVWLQIGAGLSFAQLLIAPPLFGDYWKFGFAYPITVLVLLLAPRLLGAWGTALGAAALGVLHFQMDYRSMGAHCVVIAAMVFLRALPKMARQSILVLGAAACIAASPMICEKMFASSGSGRADRSNVERSAMLQAAWEGFISSPIIGQGSWFSKSQVMENFLAIRAEKARDAGGMGFGDEDVKSAAIHSQILVSLAEGGIFGATFFILYGILIGWGLWFALTEASWHWTLPARLLVLEASFFNLFMAPFSGPIRIEIATTVVLIALFWRERADRLASLVRRGGISWNRSLTKRWALGAQS